MMGIPWYGNGPWCSVSHFSPTWYDALVISVSISTTSTTAGDSSFDSNQLERGPFGVIISCFPQTENAGLTNGIDVTINEGDDITTSGTWVRRFRRICVMTTTSGGGELRGPRLEQETTNPVIPLPLF